METQVAREAFGLYAEMAERCALSIPKPTDKLLKAIATQLREYDGLVGWKQMLTKVEASAFLRGENDTGWVVNIHWRTKSSENINKVLSGNYDKRGGPRSSPSGGVF